ncbi:carboxymuconolactone decarboxylase family protein [Streptomyces mirabilis]|uniref:carboxymuconolactone decarboxylase family protein n=1 Tax=Streptomyces mirabilis TaxID=68239 RepID=UPI0033307B65
MRAMDAEEPIAAEAGGADGVESAPGSVGGGGEGGGWGGRSGAGAGADPQVGADPRAGTDLRAAGLKAMREALPGVFPEGDDLDLRDGRLGEELVEIGLTSVWGALWAREGLSRRDRSLVTLGILIALGAETELRTHVRIARTNGLTEDEIAEVIYHATGYAGFPAATAARNAAREALAD